MAEALLAGFEVIKVASGRGKQLQQYLILKDPLNDSENPQETALIILVITGLNIYSTCTF